MAEDEDADDEEMGVAETYADYWPAKCKLTNFRPLFPFNKRIISF